MFEAKITPEIVDDGSAFARALQAFSHIDAAMAKWAGERQPAQGGAVYSAGWEALACAHAKAIDAVCTTPAKSLGDIVTKAGFIATAPILTEVIDLRVTTAIKCLASDLVALTESPLEGAFAVKLRAYERAVTDRANYEQTHKPSPEQRDAYSDFEDAMGPFHDAVCEAAQATLQEPAPNLGALAAKRRIFDTEQMEHLGEDIGKIVRILFDDAVRLAGGAE